MAPLPNSPGPAQPNPFRMATPLVPGQGQHRGNQHPTSRALWGWSLQAESSLPVTGHRLHSLLSNPQGLAQFSLAPRALPLWMAWRKKDRYPSPLISLGVTRTVMRCLPITRRSPGPRSTKIPPCLCRLGKSNHGPGEGEEGDGVGGSHRGLRARPCLYGAPPRWVGGGRLYQYVPVGVGAGCQRPVPFSLLLLAGSPFFVSFFCLLL